MRAPLASCILSLAFLAAGATVAQAQPEPPVGVRAAGMGGAFTAVADDASAVFWNPAGLAAGSYFSLVLDRNSLDTRSATLVALGTPPLGVAYYRVATGELPNSRNSLVAHHAGVTVVQSLGDRLAVGATLKLIHGVVSSGDRSVSTNRFDTDIGVMAIGSLGRLGLTVRNLTQPEFTAPDGGTAELQRRVRTGIAINTGRKTMAAADFDLTTAATGRGNWREAALGVEANPLKGAWLRGGVRWNTAGGVAAPIGTAGGSFAIYGSIHADAQVSFGSASGDRGWGVGLRYVY